MGKSTEQHGREMGEWKISHHHGTSATGLNKVRLRRSPAVTPRLIIMLKQAFRSFLMHGRTSSINRETQHLHFNAYFMENANPVLNKNRVNINCSGKKLWQEIIQTHANPCSTGPSTE